jgi:valyl-tRNA synthetase
MDKTYNPQTIEQQWYTYWEENGYFSPTDKEDASPYCIMLPPPNVTGTLHMGHAFQHTLMDILIRYQRMQGKNTLWQPGTDHAGIATQMVVERQLAQDGVHRTDLGREPFLERVWDWRKESGSTITRQLRRMGTSMDWERERFTMDEGLSSAVNRVFVELYREGLIYRGQRLVNWDPILHTAVSDLEVKSEEEKGKMWSIRYPYADGSGALIVATTRPETLLGDSAVAVHPDDERYADLIGKELRLPLTDRLIPVIADEYVDPEFGTGCVKITPAHDFNDYEVGKRHQLEMINIFTVDASLNENVPEAYRGMDRFVARKQIVADLEKAGLLESIRDHTLVIPRGDRTNSVIEPFLTDQWYVRTAPLAEPAIAAVKDGRVRFIPSNWEKTYFEWMNNIQDWCISRQIWWGHRIPAWYDEAGQVYVGYDEAEARAHHQLPDDLILTQDHDVLDTWFSSALWPFSTLGWPEKTEELERFYPTSVLVTGFDIIFFWVARMIMMGMKFMDGEVPFHEVYIHGLVRDHEGQKMSKSRGNVLDPIDLIDGIELPELIQKRTTGLMQPEMAPMIEKATLKTFPDGISAYGTDALRFTFATLASTGRDIVFDVGRIGGARNFCNKLWNAARFVLSHTEGESDLATDLSALTPPKDAALIDRWIYSRLGSTIERIHQNLKEYRFDLAAQTIYDFIWHDFCDWYLELVKPDLFNSSDPSRLKAARQTLLALLSTLLKLLHPFMPFITEEIWQRIKPITGEQAPTLMVAPFPAQGTHLIDREAEESVEWIQSFLGGIRRIRSEMNIEPRRQFPILLADASKQDRERVAQFQTLLMRLGRCSAIDYLPEGEKEPEAALTMVGDLRILVPIRDLIDKEAELSRLRREMSKLRDEEAKLTHKLTQTGFVTNAPAAIVEKEQQRLSQVQVSLKSLEAQEEKIAQW